MHDHWLIAIALSVSAMGTIILLIALTIMQPEEYSLDDTKALADGNAIRVRGTVQGVAQRGSLTIITISQPTTMDAILFENETIALNEGACVVITGKKGTYNKETQLTVTSITTC